MAAPPVTPANIQPILESFLFEWTKLIGFSRFWRKCSLSALADIFSEKIKRLKVLIFNKIYKKTNFYEISKYEFSTWTFIYFSNYHKNSFLNGDQHIEHISKLFWEFPGKSTNQQLDPTRTILQNIV